jgi:hypothetical protein
MTELRCLVYILDRVGKQGMPAKCSYSYKYKKCRCENCGLYQQQVKKKYHVENKEILKVKKKLYYEKNKKEINRKKRIYELKNIEKRKEYVRKYNQENRERIRIRKREYARRHPEMDRNKNRRKRALKRNNGFEKYTEAQVLKLYGTNCYLCNTPIDMFASRRCGDPGWEKGLHIEHVIDIALGGPDTLHNVRPSHALCNLKKKPREMV